MVGLNSIELRDISKRFGDVVALAQANLQLHGREVHVLAGENGSGKTTLMNVLAGLYQPDSGTIWIDGRRAAFNSPRDALRLRIGMVHQHFELVGPFTVLESVLLGHEGAAWRLRLRERRRPVETLMRRYGLAIDLDARIHDLSVGVQQKVEILKTLYRGVELLILDEPTTHLTPQEVDGLFATVHELVAGGLTVVLITHKLREIRDIADRVSVMRRGQVVATLQRADASEARLVELLMGQQRLEQAAAPPLSVPAPGASLLRLEHVTTAHLADCSFEVRSGEVVGVAGVAGNGQRHLVDAITGAGRIQAGRMLLRDRDVTRCSVRQRLLLGLGYVPEDRLHEGILPRLSLAETYGLGLHHVLFSGRWSLDEGRMRSLARDAIAEYRIAAPSERVGTARLSGGNIQKVLIARAMRIAATREPSLLVATNPSRGLDLSTTKLVHRRLTELRARGGGVLLVSEDLDELLRLSDRILVLYRGRIAGEFPHADFDAYAIGSVMAGGAVGSSVTPAA